jgi:hypothetical protein
MHQFILFSKERTDWALLCAYNPDNVIQPLIFRNYILHCIAVCWENRVPRRIFGPKRDKVMGEWKEMHSGERHNFYSSPDIIRQIKSRRMRWAGHVAHMEEWRNVYMVWVGKPKAKRPLERPRHRWEDGIKMDLTEIGWGGGVDSPGSG